MYVRFTSCFYRFPPFFIFFLYNVVDCVTDIFCWSSLDFLPCVNLFIGKFHGFLYFNHRAVLSFWTAGRLLFGRFIDFNIKVYTRWFPTNGFSTNRCIKFANYWRGSFLLLNSVSVESSLNGTVLVGNFSFRVGAAKSSFITSLLSGVSVVLITLFSDILQLLIERSINCLSLHLCFGYIFFLNVKQYHLLLDHLHIYTRGIHHSYNFQASFCH